MDGWSWASEFDHGDEVVRVAQAVGHADGDLDLVVERFDPGVGMAEPDGCEDVVAACADLPAWFDDLGDAAAGRPADPSFEFRFGPFDGLARERAVFCQAVVVHWGW